MIFDLSIVFIFIGSAEEWCTSTRFRWLFFVRFLLLVLLRSFKWAVDFFLMICTHGFFWALENSRRRRRGKISCHPFLRSRVSPLLPFHFWHFFCWYVLFTLSSPAFRAENKDTSSMLGRGGGLCAPMYTKNKFQYYYSRPKEHTPAQFTMLSTKYRFFSLRKDGWRVNWMVGIPPKSSPHKSFGVEFQPLDFFCPKPRVSFKCFWPKLNLDISVVFYCIFFAVIHSGFVRSHSGADLKDSKQK